MLLLNDDNVERLFGENRPAGDFCLLYAQRKQRKKGDDVLGMALHGYIPTW